MESKKKNVGTAIFFGAALLGITTASVRKLIVKLKERSSEKAKMQDWILHNGDKVIALAKQYGITADNFDKKVSELMSTMSNVMLREVQKIDMKKIKKMIRANFDNEVDAFDLPKNVSKDYVLRAFAIDDIKATTVKNENAEFAMVFDKMESIPAEYSVMEGLQIFIVEKFKKSYPDLYEFQIIEPTFVSYDNETLDCKISEGPNFKAFKKIIKG